MAYTHTWHTRAACTRDMHSLVTEELVHLGRAHGGEQRDEERPSANATGNVLSPRVLERVPAASERASE